MWWRSGAAGRPVSDLHLLPPTSVSQRRRSAISACDNAGVMCGRQCRISEPLHLIAVRRPWVAGAGSIPPRTLMADQACAPAAQAEPVQLARDPSPTFTYCPVVQAVV